MPPIAWAPPWCLPASAISAIKVGQVPDLPRAARARLAPPTAAPRLRNAEKNLDAARKTACATRSHTWLVRRRPIHRRHRDVVEAQVNRKLAAVVHTVVEHEAAQYRHLRHGEEHFLTGLERPRLHERAVFCG